jgi:hypothetical protein
MLQVHNVGRYIEKAPNEKLQNLRKTIVVIHLHKKDLKRWRLKVWLLIYQKYQVLLFINFSTVCMKLQGLIT